MCFYYVAFPLSAYGLSYWLPTIVQDFGVSNTANGFINIIPWIVVALALWFNPRWAAKSGQRRSLLDLRWSVQPAWP
jgi:cyanate permease